MQYDQYQQAVLNMANAGESLLVDSTAGSGKTTIACAMAELLPTNSVLAITALNSVANVLTQRMPRHVKITNFHKAGNAALYKAAKNGQYPKPHVAERGGSEKTYSAVHQAIQEYPHAWRSIRNPDDARNTVKKLMDMARLTLRETDIESVARHFGISYEGPELQVAQTAIAISNRMYEETGIIDLNDMIYVPVRYELDFNTSDVVIVDEYQDMNPVQQAIAYLMASQRIIFFGDSKQAIMGFAGADTRVVDAIRAQGNVKELLMPVCYRCPQSHIRLAQRAVPYIKARPNAPEGTIRNIFTTHVGNHVGPGNLVIARYNSHLVESAAHLNSQGHKATIRGGNYGKSLMQMVDTISQKAVVWSLFIRTLTKHAEEEVARLAQKHNSQSEIVNLMDQVTSIQRFHSITNPKSVEELLETIQDTFNGDPDTSINHSTIHRAKGTEADNVFLLYPSDMAPRADQQAWEQEQEVNAWYVAHTRAKDKLYLVEAI